MEIKSDGKKIYDVRFAQKSANNIQTVDKSKADKGR